jgi:hypothetical protein
LIKGNLITENRLWNLFKKIEHFFFFSKFFKNQKKKKKRKNCDFNFWKK